MRRDALRNRRRLLEAAREVFAEHGHRAGVDEIARRADLGIGTLYRHFPTKDDLLDTLWQELLDGIVDRATATAAEQPPGLGLEGCLWDLCAEMESYRSYLGSMWHAFPPSDHSHRLHIWVLMQRLLREAQQAGEVRDDLLLSDVFLAVVSVRGIIDQTQDTAPGTWRRHLSILLAGFRRSHHPLRPALQGDGLISSGVLRRLPDPEAADTAP
ncbi:TetR/AcrR family transcriptional regulator [Nocardia tengchongensis]